MSATGVNWDSLDMLRLVADLTGDGTSDIVGFAQDDVWISLGNGDGTFAPARAAHVGFGSSQGWTTSKHPRFLADLTGDGKADIVGFGGDGVWISLNNGDGTFAPARYVLANFGYNQGWHNERHPRLLADLTGDGKADIVGFGDDSVWTALGNGDGSFAEAHFVVAGLGYNQSWRVESHPRLLADLTGDGKADIVGFGDDGVWTAVSQGDGSFGGPNFVLANFGHNQGWRVDKDTRLLADQTGEGKRDIVAFGDDGVWTALSNGDGSFAEPHFVLANFGSKQGWQPAQHLRVAADLRGDGRSDIVGFGDDGMWIALSNGDGSFGEPSLVLSGFNPKQGWTVDLHPRFVTKLSGDRRADIIGFGDDGVWTSLGVPPPPVIEERRRPPVGGPLSDNCAFDAARFVLADFGARSGIRKRVIPHSYLQTKFDTFFNHRQRPLFQICLDNPGKTFGYSTLTIAVDQNNSGVPAYNFDKPLYILPLMGLSFPVFDVDYNFYFQQLNTDQLTLNITGHQPLTFQLMIHFEVGGLTEIKVDGHTGQDIDIQGFNIKLNLELARTDDGRLDPFAWSDEIEKAVKEATTEELTPLLAKATTTFRGETIIETGGTPDKAINSIRQKLTGLFIMTDANVDVGGGWPDGTVADDIESNFTSRIYDSVKPSPDANKPNAIRESLSGTLSTWLLGGDYHAVGLSNDSQNTTIEYVVPPGQVEPFPENPQTPLDQGALADIHHIVVLMMENRSFDHMLGYLSLDPSVGGKGRTDVDGHGPQSSIPNPLKDQSFLPFRVTDPEYVHHSPPHEHELVVGQINGGAMNGFVEEYASEWQLEGFAAADVMSYYDGTVLTIYDALADNFLVCDRWFAAHPGPTFCNRFYTLTGRLNRDKYGATEFNNMSGDDFVPVETKTVFDHLSDRGVSWRYYEQRYCALRMFSRYTFDDVNIVDFYNDQNGFAAAAAAGALPSVTFIDPNFVDEPDAGDNDDGAPGNVQAGQALIGQIVHALMNGPDWDSTLLFITYDEHGGFFDHVSPLQPEYRPNALPVSNIDFFGVRVPAIVVSPRVAKGQVSHEVFDHTSILKTISRRFMSADPPDMGERVAAANDLSVVIQSVVRQDRPSIPSPPQPYPQSGFAASPDPNLGQSTEFKDVMRYLYLRRHPIHV